MAEVKVKAKADREDPGLTGTVAADVAETTTRVAIRAQRKRGSPHMKIVVRGHMLCHFCVDCQKMAHYKLWKIQKISFIHKCMRKQK